MGWMPFAEHIAKRILKDEKIDIVVSRANPITSHLIGLRLKSIFNLPLVTIFGDPWTQNPTSNTAIIF